MREALEREKKNEKEKKEERREAGEKENIILMRSFIYIYIYIYIYLKNFLLQCTAIDGCAL